MTILFDPTRTALQIRLIQKSLMPFVPDRMMERNPPVPNSALTEKRSVSSFLNASEDNLPIASKSSFIHPEADSNQSSYCFFSTSYSGNFCHPINPKPLC